MADAATLQTQIDNLQAAIASGVLVVQHGTDRVQYQSYASMKAALQSLQAQLAEANGDTPRSRVNYIEQKSKGFGHGFGGFVGRDWTEQD